MMEKKRREEDDNDIKEEEKDNKHYGTNKLGLMCTGNSKIKPSSKG